MEKERRGYKAHVLVFPLPFQGHINPMLQFCKRLVSKGVKATLVTTIYISKSMYAGPSSSVNMEAISDGFDEGGFAQAASPEAYLTTFRAVGSQALASLINSLDDSRHPVDALVYDPFLPWALDVAKQLGLFGAAFFTQSCAVNSIYYHAYHGLLALPLSESTVSLPGLPVLQPWETPSFIYLYGSYPVYYDMVVNQFSNINKADSVLFPTFFQMEAEVVNWMAKLWRVRTVGPSLPSMYLDKRVEDDRDYSVNLFKPSSEACMSWLNDKPKWSVVYVSFGSVAEIEAEQMEELAWGLKNSNSYFLWVVRASEEHKLPGKFIDQTLEKGLFVTWCPQLEVLVHEAIGCFVTHCGFNSVIEAMSLGVPMVALPQWTDQPTNAKYVEDVWGIGLRAGRDEKGSIVRRQVLELCIKEVMAGERGKELKERAMKWKESAREAVDEAGSSDKSINEFVADLVHLLVSQLHMTTLICLSTIIPTSNWLLTKHAKESRSYFLTARG